jgi:O-acetyl-ADP-ribose deacetylase (regulator of RNase III)
VAKAKADQAAKEAIPAAGEEAEATQADYDVDMQFDPAESESLERIWTEYIKESEEEHASTGKASLTSPATLKQKLLDHTRGMVRKRVKRG